MVEREFTLAERAANRRPPSPPEGQLPSDPMLRQRYILEAARYYHYLAYRDELTGLPNTRAWADISEKAHSRASRDRQPVLYFAVDCDGFKGVNDRYGHQVGDELLKAIASAMQSALRSTDFIARTGGDEFSGIAVISPAPGLTQAQIAKYVSAGALKVMTRLRQAIKNNEFLKDPRFAGVSISVGGCLYYGDATPLSTVLISADQALYASKDQRNWVTLFDPDPRQPTRKRTVHPPKSGLG